MKSLKKFLRAANPRLLILSSVLALSTAACSRAIDEKAAYDIARRNIDAKYQSEVLMIQGKGDRSSINEWAFYFYQPGAGGKTKQVVVKDGKLDAMKSVKIKIPSGGGWAFDPNMTGVSGTEMS